MSKTRVAVVGVGHHGRHHARNLAEMPDVDLVAVVDTNQNTAQSVALLTKTTPMPDTKDLLGRVDAVCVCVPTVHHLEIAHQFLDRGIATLVEKPLALYAEEAREMVRIGQLRNTVLQVGHIERFNPAWAVVEGSAIRPSSLDSVRLSPYPFRSLDVSVVFDLMIHDLDLALSLANSAACRISAAGSRVQSSSFDWADARIVFENGLEANISASRVHHESVRNMRLWDGMRSMEVDFLHRTAESRELRVESPEPEILNPNFRLSTLYPQPSTLNSQPSTLNPQPSTLNPQPSTLEPLRLELEDFIGCVRNHTKPKVDGQAGYAAVVLASQIERAMVESIPERILRKSA